MLPIFRFTLCCCLLAAQVLGQKAAQPQVATPASTAPKISAYLGSLPPFGFSGQIRVESKGHLLTSENLGFADRKYLKPVSDNTLFAIGSVTKQFTAAAVMQLESQERLALTDPLSRFFKDVPADKAPITLQQLLTHSSGLRREAVSPSEGLDRDHVLQRIWDSKLSPPGVFHYSNAGYQVLAAVIEMVSGKSYESYLRDNLMQPAGLQNICFEKDPHCSYPVARGYNEWKEVSDPTLPTGWLPLGNTGILASAGDLLQWTKKLYGGDVLPAASTKRLFSPQIKSNEDLDYAYGWFVGNDSHGEPLIMHGGDVPGYRSELRFYPRQQTAIVVLCNQDRNDYGVYRRIIANDIENILSGRPAKLVPPEVKEARIPTRWLGEFRSPHGGLITIYRDDAGEQWAGVSGQEALNGIFGAGIAPSLNEAQDRSSEVIEAALTGDATKMTAALPGQNMASFRDALTQTLQGAVVLFGKPKKIEIMGSIPLLYDSGSIRTFLRVHGEDGETQLFLGWNKDGLYDITFNDDRPYAFMIPVAWKDHSTIVGYDFDQGSRLRFELGLHEGHPDSVLLNGITASRVR